MQRLPFPFPGDRFPHNLGAAVQRTVADRIKPARMVAHTEDGSWLVADGVNDPNVEGACIIAALVHLVVDDPTIGELTTLEPGTHAWRDGRGDAWHERRVGYRQTQRRPLSANVPSRGRHSGLDLALRGNEPARRR